MVRKALQHVPSQLIPLSMFTDQPYWKRLAKDEQQTVIEETQKIGQLGFKMKAARLEVGKRLTVLHKVLKENFRAHIKNLNIKEKTAYRIMEDYKETEKIIPTQVLPVLMALNYDFAQKKYRQILKRLPAPATSDPAVVGPWCEEVEAAYKKQFRAGREGGDVEVLGPEGDPEEMLKEAFRFTRIRFHRLPHNSKSRTRWLEKLFGYLLTELGVSGSHTFKPEAASDEFLRGRGRPPETVQ